MLLEILLVMSVFSLILPELSRQLRLFVSFVDTHYTSHLAHLDRTYMFDALYGDLQSVSQLSINGDDDYTITLDSGHYISYSLSKGRLGRSYDGKRRHFLCNHWTVDSFQLVEEGGVLSLTVTGESYTLVVQGLISV